MDGDQEQRHCCKVCGKSFPSGRSLGGHMRSHLPLNSSAEAEERPKSSRSFAPVAAGYGLRENPRRTWRLSDSNAANSSIRDKLCRECGKCFPSRRSLFRHMRRHSTRPREALEDDEEEEEEEDKAQGLEEQQGSWSLGGDKLCLESQSDTEANAAAVPKRMRRSRRLAAIPDSSSSVSEYEKEQEDVALSLMMLSRDIGLRGSNALAITESSDKNSVVLEDKGIAQESNAKKKGLEPGDLGQGRPRNGLKRVDSDASDDGYIFKDEFTKHKVDFNAGKLEDSSTKKNLSSVDELERNESFDELDQKVGKCNPANFFASQRLGFNSSEKRSRYECTTCSKVFHSYQALGGHRASHKRTNGCLPRRINGSELSMETNGSSDPALMEEMSNQNVGIEAGYGSLGRFKGHECPICRKVFPSGQALGGHKRSHLLASSAASHDTIVVKQQTPVMPELLDLNLPAPVNEGSNDTNVNSELKPLWIATEFRSDSVLGLNSK